MMRYFLALLAIWGSWMVGGQQSAGWCAIIIAVGSLFYWLMKYA